MAEPKAKPAPTPPTSTPAKRGRPPKPKEIEAGTTEQAGEQIARTSRNGGKTPANLEGGSSAKKEDVSRILGNCLKWYSMPQVKTDDELEERIGQFFVTCLESGEIPTVEKMCMATGFHRQTVWEWENGVSQSKLGPRAGDIIKKGKEFLSTFEAEMVTEGKINPVVYIFRAKNYFGMKDQQDYIITPNNPLGSGAEPKQIADKYQATLPEAGDYESE